MLHNIRHDEDIKRSQVKKGWKVGFVAHSDKKKFRCTRTDFFNELFPFLIIIILYD